MSRMGARVLVLGCGNALFGDDGFGPALISRLKEDAEIPEGVWLEDVGTGVRDILFDLLLSDKRPGMLIVVDAARKPGRFAGELFEIPVEEVEAEKANDFSVHHFPSVNMLVELANMGDVDVRLLAVQAADIPDEVRPGLSMQVQSALPEACARIKSMLKGSYENVRSGAFQG